MLPLITSKIKDDVLQWLCQNVPVGKKSTVSLAIPADIVNIETDAMKAILDNFHRIGLIDIQKYSLDKSVAILVLTVKGHDLLSRGGFAVEDALNEANIQKILLELRNLQKQLKPDQVDALSKLTSITSAIATIYTAFSDKN